MRQLQFIEKGKLEWREAPDPRLQGDGEAIIRPVALATCDLDAAFVRGVAPVANPFPFGHECVGEITEVGDSVKSVKPRMPREKIWLCRQTRSCTSRLVSSSSAS